MMIGMAVIAISISNILEKENNLIVHIKRHALSMHPEVLFIGPVVHMNIDRQLVSLYTSTAVISWFFSQSPKCKWILLF